ncbi:MAG: hypothetical protein Q4G43_03775 [Mobilicoccus sp.]|nr:hypothetical protein [Mobilicoccus sp.]
MSAPPPLLFRAGGEIQVGLDTDAVVLAGLSPAEVLSLEQVRRQRVRPVPGSRLGEVLAELRTRGLAPPPRGGRLGVVVIDGDGAVTRRLVPVLREEGVIVHHGRGAFDDADSAQRRGTTLATGDRPTLIVQIAAHALSPVRAWPHALIPCLPVILRQRSVSIGPLTRPGGPCLRCLDLTHSDLDPAWPSLLAQLGETGDPVEESPLTLLAAALTATTVLGHLTDPVGGGPSGLSIEASAHPPLVTHRRWPVHPRCVRPHPPA